MLELLHPSVLGPWLLGMCFGIFVGATPGLTATMAVALIVPVSFYLPPSTGLALIIGVSFTAIFAGDIPATLLRIPGTPASAAATLDGYPLAQRGQGGHALMIDLFCSVLGGVIGVMFLMWTAPQLARFALGFSHFEYFWLATMGLSVSALVSRGSTFKGLLSACLGLLLATVGIDSVSGVQRFTLGQPQLLDGFGFIPVLIGVFGLSEVFRYAHASASADGSLPAVPPVRSSPIQALRSILRRPRLLLQSSCIGTFIGALPGAGADIAAWAAYGAAQKTSRKPDQFGAGSEEGVIAPTTANNAAVAGAWIPALVFGIPGDAVTAIVLGAFLMYDIKPGPLLFQQNPAQVQFIFLLALLTQLLLLPCGYAGIRFFGWLLRAPRRVVMTCVLVFSVVGAYALRNSLFDVWTAFAFGLVGFFLQRRHVPLAPLILGLILGPMIEQNLRTGLIKTDGQFGAFFTRPLCAGMVAILVLAFAGPPLWRQLIGRREDVKREDVKRDA